MCHFYGSDNLLIIRNYRYPKVLKVSDIQISTL